MRYRSIPNVATAKLSETDVQQVNKKSPILFTATLWNFLTGDLSGP